MYLKIPATISGTRIQLQKAYIAYLWFKNRSENGFFAIAGRGNDRFADHYWSKKLISLGWMTPNEGGFMLRTYQFVWRSMGIKKIRRRKSNQQRLHFQYIKLKETFQKYSRRKFHTEVLAFMREIIAERKKNQLAFRLVSDTSCTPKSPSKIRKLIRAFRKHEKPEFSSASSAKIFGYRSSSSGWKVRREVFKVEPRGQLQMFLHPSNLPFFRYPSSKISIV